MARKTLGLALGSGSAKGFAHMGALAALEENNIPVDYICGCSMGAVVGGIYACGTNIRLMSKAVPMINEKPYMDVTIPKGGGFIRGERFMELVKLLSKDYEFKDTKIPFSCVAVDLLSAQLVVMDEGKIYDAVRGSFSIPGVFKPHKWRGKMLVDGGLMARVPSRIVREMGADVVVGIDVAFRGAGGGDYKLPLEGTMDYIWAAFDIMSWEVARNQEKDADLIVAPYVWDMPWKSTEGAATIIGRGHEAMVQAIPRIRELLELD